MSYESLPTEGEPPISILEDAAACAFEDERLLQEFHGRLDADKPLPYTDYELDSPAIVNICEWWSEQLGIEDDPVAKDVLYRAHTFAILLASELVLPFGMEFGTYYTQNRPRTLAGRMAEDADRFYNEHTVLHGWVEYFMFYIDPKQTCPDTAFTVAGMTFKHIEAYHRKLHDVNRPVKQFVDQSLHSEGV